MNTQQIKDTYSMRDVLGMYGVKVDRHGMCCCPIHREKHPSMKVYQDSYNCFACGANGDIFSFVQAMENCDFKTAFYRLGGKYQHDGNRSKLSLYRAQKGIEKRKIKEQKIKQKKKDLNSDINLHRSIIRGYEALQIYNDDFWESLEKYYMGLILSENLEGGDCGD